MPVPAPTLLNLDTLLKVWAVLGPLVAAGVSAWWSRRNQVNDRDYGHSLEMERLDRADTARILDHQRAVRTERHNAIKESLADFMASSHEYVRKQSDWLANPIPEKHQAASQATDTFTYSSQGVILLGDEQLADKAVELWNATLKIPKSYKTPINEQYEQDLDAYKLARADFNTHARRYLDSLAQATDALQTAA